ncbi:hypothetical protein Trydic_g19186 [Trypoxylus dichotomus]
MLGGLIMINEEKGAKHNFTKLHWPTKLLSMVEVPGKETWEYLIVNDDAINTSIALQAFLAGSSKGFNYALSKLPVEKVLCRFKNIIITLEANTAETVRQEVCAILRNTRLPKKNFSTEKLKVLIELKRNEKIIILPAGKGNDTVVLNTKDHKDEMQKLLDDLTYNLVAIDPTIYLEKTIRTKIISWVKKFMIPRERSPKCPKMYGLSKVHKPNVPLRPSNPCLIPDNPTKAKRRKDGLLRQECGAHHRHLKSTTCEKHRHVSQLRYNYLPKHLPMKHH